MGTDGRVRDQAELQRRAFRRHVLLGLAAVAVTLAMAAVAAGVIGLRASGPDPGLGVGWWLLFTVLVLLPVALILGMLRLQQRERFSWLPGPGLLLGADRATRRRVGRAVRRGDLPVEEPERALVLDTARRTVALRWSRIVFALTAVTQGLNSLVQHPGFLCWILAGNAVLLAVGAVHYSVLLRGARRILALPAAGARPGPDDRAG